MQNPDRDHSMQAPVLLTGAASAGVTKSAAAASIQGQNFYIEPPAHGPKPKVAMLMFPGLTLLDLIGPHTALAAWCDVYLVWINTDQLMSDTGVVLRADTTLAECPLDLDVIFVPGGPGRCATMIDSIILDFLADRGSRAKYVTSVCSGALVLGAAGLLKGYRATTHWAALPLLPMFGATAEDKRVVIDRNRITGGGITAGIDFGLTLLAVLLGENTARLQQLSMQYDPQPPYEGGHPGKVTPELVRQSVARMQAAGIGNSDMVAVIRKAAANVDQYAQQS